MTVSKHFFAVSQQSGSEHLCVVVGMCVYRVCRKKICVVVGIGSQEVSRVSRFVNWVWARLVPGPVVSLCFVCSSRDSRVSVQILIASFSARFASLFRVIRWACHFRDGTRQLSQFSRSKST